LRFSQSGHGEHNITVAGEGKASGKPHLLELADNFEVREIDAVIEELLEAVAQWSNFAKMAGVSQGSRNDIGRDMKRIMERF